MSSVGEAKNSVDSSHNDSNKSDPKMEIRHKPELSVDRIKSTLDLPVLTLVKNSQVWLGALTPTLNHLKDISDEHINWSAPVSDDVN